MAYDHYLAERIERYFSARKLEVRQKFMMGGVAFMLDGKMCVGVNGESLMARIGPEHYEVCLKREGCREMTFTGRAMAGYVFVDPIGMDTDEELAFYLDLAVDFNPQAKASKSRKKKE